MPSTPRDPTAYGALHRQEMHFSKTYTQFIVTLPPELRNNVFEYRKLKQLINQTVSELDSLGFGPSVLQSLQTHENSGNGLACVEVEHGDNSAPIADSESVSNATCQPTIIYEIDLNSSLLEPRLRLSSRHASDVGHSHPTAQPIYHVDLVIPEQSLSRITQTISHPPIISAGKISLPDNLMEPDHVPELVVPLPSDAAFFQLLMSSLSSISGHWDTLHDGFNSALTTLAASISSAARPASSIAPHSFSAYSFSTHNAMSLRPGLPGGKSDLYAWREIFRFYAEAEVFEIVSESTRGERRIEEVERQLKLFKELAQKKRGSLVLPESREALDVFLGLNLFILGVKKLQLANSEAARKILKKHVKRTKFPLPTYLLEQGPSVSTPSLRRVMFITRPSTSLPRRLVQAIGEVLLPVVPHIDDYSCLICTCIAFRPIRLRCGHFFCVRCLAKLQKRRRPNCPMCRAPTVLKANPSNVDYGLLNFMADWFPIESREKLRANEREVIQEQYAEFGLADVRGCRIM